MYVISVMRKCGFQKDYKWCYAALDEYAGSYSTGLPCWDSFDGHSEVFKTVEAAEKWFEENRSYLMSTGQDIKPETLGIREKIYKTVKELK